MADRVDLLGLLDAEWTPLAECPSNRRRLRCWQVEQPPLRGVDGLREVVQRIDEGTLEESTAIVWALLELVESGDEGLIE